MIAILLVTAAAAAVQATKADIVVTGQRLDEANAECMAYRCAPLRDVQVSIAWAERAFRRGEYVAAKRGLAAAVARNRGAAATAPRPVAALYEAYATVTLHEGDLDAYKSAVGAQARTLRANLPADDPAVIRVQLALGDMWLKSGYAQDAEAAYERTQREAVAHGQGVTALTAGLRLFGLALGTRQPGKARRILDDIAHSPVGQDERFQAMVPALRLRVAVMSGDKGDVDRQLSTLAQMPPVAAPVLIWNPPMQQTPLVAAQKQANQFFETTMLALRSMEVGAVEWADIGYWIRPDGRTDDVILLRSSARSGWMKGAIDQVSGRRYAALAPDPTGQGMYRVERYTLRGKYDVPVGSLIRRRTGGQRIETIDITEGSARPIG